MIDGKGARWHVKGERLLLGPGRCRREPPELPGLSWPATISCVIVGSIVVVTDDDGRLVAVGHTDRTEGRHGRRALLLIFARRHRARRISLDVG